VDNGSVLLQMKTYEEINRKIESGRAVVMTAEEIIGYVERNGADAAAKEVDVVTTATFGPMCSSGCVLNFGHSTPRIRISEAWVDDVRVYAGLAAVDAYLGATELRHGDPANMDHPGEFKYGGGHVIEKLVAGETVQLFGLSYGTDEYPRREVRTWFTIQDLNQAIMVNPRNCYQNYNVAVNRDSSRVIYTYMGVLQPNMKNATYCSAGQLSPLLKDPLYRTIGIGTRIFIGGTQGYVYWYGTQHNPTVRRLESGAPVAPAGTIAVIGDLKQMSTRYLRGASLVGYGSSLTVGLGIPIPVLDEDVVRRAALRDEDLVAQVVDYSTDYPQGVARSLGQVTYKQLKSGKIVVDGREIPTAGLSSYSRAKEIAGILKEWIRKGEFYLTEPVQPLPGPDSGLSFKPFVERPIG
jgi:uncharacterized protein (DUF39 family)